MNNNPIFCALDTNNLEKAKKIAEQIKPFVGGYKLGLEFFTSFGIDGFAQLKKIGLPIFIDLKFYDIPNTVASALKNILELEPYMTTIHISGGTKMISACLELKEQMKSKTKLIGVTMLTSFSDAMIKEIGHVHSIKESIDILAGVADKIRIDGVVCSPLEVSSLKNKYPSLELVVPGIRDKKDSSDDQVRILTAKETINQGADYLVVGRPITESTDPAKTAEEIFNTIKWKVLK